MIRYATKNDLKPVFELIKLLSSEEFTYEQFEASFAYNLQNNHILLYVENGEVAGLGVLVIFFPLHHSKKIAEIIEIVTVESARGKGIGKKLLDEMATLAAKNDCANIELASNKKRTDAHRFYEREGLVPTHFKFTKKLI